MKSYSPYTFAMAFALVTMLAWVSPQVFAMGHKEPKIVAADDSTAPSKNSAEGANGTAPAAAPAPKKKVESSNPFSGDADAIDTGKKLYFTWCVQCHGHKANGESRFGKYAGDLTHFWRGYKEFIKIVQNGRPDKMMPPWKNVLDEETISRLGAFLETLAEEGAVWK